MELSLEQALSSLPYILNTGFQILHKPLSSSPEQTEGNRALRRLPTPF